MISICNKRIADFHKAMGPEELVVVEKLKIGADMMLVRVRTRLEGAFGWPD